MKPDETPGQAEEQPDGGETEANEARDMEQAQKRAAKERETEGGYQ